MEKVAGWEKIEVMVCANPDICIYKKNSSDAHNCFFVRGTMRICTRYSMSEKEADNAYLSFMQSRKRLYGNRLP